MGIVGFSFTKMVGERLEKAVGQININNNIKITHIEEADLSVTAADQKGLKFSFRFTVHYDPKVANLTFDGEIVSLQTKERADAILKRWSDEQRVGPEVSVDILNAALARCNVQSILMAQELSLPSPVPLPKVQPPQEKEVKEAKS